MVNIHLGIFHRTCSLGKVRSRMIAVGQQRKEPGKTSRVHVIEMNSGLPRRKSTQQQRVAKASTKRQGKVADGG